MPNDETSQQNPDSVTQVNVKLVGEAPAEALAHASQSLAHAMGQAMEHAAQTPSGSEQVTNVEPDKK